MKKHVLTTAVLVGGLWGAAAAAGPDVDVISRVTGLQPEVKNGVAKVTAPRADLGVTVDGIKMQPFQGFTSWAAFEGSGDRLS